MWPHKILNNCSLSLKMNRKYYQICNNKFNKKKMKININKKMQTKKLKIYNYHWLQNKLKVKSK